ncbi:MAG: helix-turn-helix domain-containing protein [Gemmatimonadota bacterium]|nr:MAG: helix-turn-helix domain-containing protein [Gemmatimonadota bacterium]
MQADLTVAKVAAIFDRHPNRIRDWVARGELSAYKLHAREWRIPRSSIKESQKGQAGGSGREYG